ncbi:NAD-dependent epimerase/dehydratase family protein [Parapedobacter tibetensis]|uniref:NAD-dependent epimerase/dehydratase family protein n=1 Tax=Parapedobacter tibetensis TaxID=2972951 RepID=UPI00214DBBE7|nr:NAD(P)-dependent oxidoreductase [Parapedobacter tibetensis]
MKIFVTGGSGFVGENIIPDLINEGHEVYALARSSGSAEKVTGLGAIPVRDDLTSLSKNTEQALRNCELVFHSAVFMNFSYNPKPFYSINVDATKQLLSMAQKVGVRKFIFLSAAPVVPGSPLVNLTEDQAEKGLPRDLYPKTKAIAEKAVLEANSDNFQTIALRPPLIWGPYNHHYEQVFKRIKDGKWRWVGGGHQILSTIHIKNLSQALFAAIRSDIGGEAFFITDGDRRSWRKTLTEIAQAYGLDPGEKEMPRWVAVIMARIFGSIWKTFRLSTIPPVSPPLIRLMATEFSVSDQKARRELGYKNVITFEEGISALKK